nr:MAG TPA: hypothetical protein [Caudoviricetes sp.]
MQFPTRLMQHPMQLFLPICRVGAAILLKSLYPTYTHTQRYVIIILQYCTIPIKQHNLLHNSLHTMQDKLHHYKTHHNNVPDTRPYDPKQKPETQYVYIYRLTVVHSHSQ